MQKRSPTGQESDQQQMLIGITMPDIKIEQIIHIGKLHAPATDRSLPPQQRGKKIHLAFLVESYDKNRYEWLEAGSLEEWSNTDQKTTVLLDSLSSIGQACAKARKLLASREFRTLHCGKLFLERKAFRDEIGMPALFFHLYRSYQSSSGLFLDADYGCMARVDEPSMEALELLKELKTLYNPPP